MRNQSIAVSDGIKVMSLQNNSSPIFSLTQTQQKKKPMPMASKLIKLLETQPILSANWVDSMRASSPPRSSFSDHDNSWTASHPSALEKFDRIMKASKGKQIVVFLDYDGTLSPIVKDPDSAYMSVEMRAAVKAVAKHFPTAIVSGRSKDKVYDFVKLKELYYAGSHGMDIQGPANIQGKESILFQPENEILVMIDQVYWKLVEKTKSIQGAKVEHNKFCVSVHFRCVDDKKWAELADQVKTVLNEYPKLKMNNGRKVLEIRPTIKWDKGKALEFLLKTLGYENSKDVLPIYIGDDRTDEDAFKVLRKKKQGLGILVSKLPKETNAAYTLRDPSEVMKFLERLVEWKQVSRHGYTLPCDQDEINFSLKYFL